MNVFIDGQDGTVGLQLEQRLRGRPDVTLLEIDPNDIKKCQDLGERKERILRADVVFLCLPDEHARISASIAPADTLVIDASTAHRTAPGWAYGLPELSPEHRAAIQNSRRIAVTGCHAAGFIAAIYPLISSGLLPRDTRLSCTSLTGYSGGGRDLIAAYRTNRTPDDPLHAPRPYALGLHHKHLAEMKAVCGLDHAPLFLPVLGDMYQGMLVTVPLWADARVVWETLYKHYIDSHFIKVMPFAPELPGGCLDPTACNGTNRLELFVFGHETQALIVSRLDNLGKGASGAAVQCMNIACGLQETMGLEG